MLVLAITICLRFIPAHNGELDPVVTISSHGYVTGYLLI